MKQRHKGTRKWPIVGIYLHEFTNKAAECSIENFEFIVSELVQVNPDNSRAMSALTFLLFKLNTLQTKIVKL